VAIETIDLSGQHVAVGEKVDVMVFVMNKGMAPMTTDVTMFSSDPDQDGGPVSVTLGPGEGANVTFSYKPSRTSDNITVVVDRTNKVYEANEDNNVRTIVAKAKHAPGGDIPGFEPALGLLACMIAGIGLSIRSRGDRTL